MAEFENNKYKIKIRDIKSPYILRTIFSFLEEIQKLNMILYNKELQKKSFIDFEDYKKIRKKYRIIDKNGNGKEYLIESNKLIFDGGYLNGKRNGKGKEFDYEGKLIYEGEYLKGKRNGKGKEYYKNGQLLFAGEYLNGKKWNGNGYNIYGELKFEIKEGKGYIKEYGFYSGKLVFEGEYKNGERNGNGKEYDYNYKLIFEGKYLNGRRNGKGKEYYSNGQILFEGEYINGKIWNGNGYNIQGNFEFEIKDGKGNVKEYNYFRGKLLFEGEYRNGERNGRGIEYDYDHNIRFIGEYLNGKRIYKTHKQNHN